MLKTSLLDKEDGAFVRRPSCFEGHEARMSECWCEAVGIVQNWWRCTTHVLFLSSTASRRGSRVAWLLFAVCNYALDIKKGVADLPTGSLLGKAYTVPDLLLIIVVTITLRMPRASTSADALTVCFLTIGFTSLDVRTLRNDSYLQTLKEQPYDELYWAILMLWTGLHSSAVFLYITVTSAFTVWLGAVDVDLVIWIYFFGCCCTLGGMVIDYSIAKLILELEAQRSATECLLDHASDGFCTVNITSGIVTYASSKLENTLHTNELKGMCLDQFVQPSDVALLQNLYASVATNCKLKPVMLTCRTLTHVDNMQRNSNESDVFQVFDAKLIPYSSDSKNLSISIQVLGELRSSDLHSVAAVHHLGSVPEASAAMWGSALPAGLGGLLTTAGEFDALSYSESEVTSKPFTVISQSHVQSVEIGVQTMLDLPPTMPSRKSLDWHPFSSEESPWTSSGRSSRIPTPPSSPRTSSNRPHRMVDVGGRRDPRPKHQKATRSSNPLISCFVKTPPDTRCMVLLSGMKHNNVPRRPGGCCLWHMALRDVKSMVHHLEKTRKRCDALWSPHLDWQCSTCNSLNQAVSHCTICFRPREVGGSGNMDVFDRSLLSRARSPVAKLEEAVPSSLPVPFARSLLEKSVPSSSSAPSEAPSSEGRRRFFREFRADGPTEVHTDHHRCEFRTSAVPSLEEAVPSSLPDPFARPLLETSVASSSSAPPEAPSSEGRRRFFREFRADEPTEVHTDHHRCEFRALPVPSLEEAIPSSLPLPFARPSLENSVSFSLSAPPETSSDEGCRRFAPFRGDGPGADRRSHEQGADRHSRDQGADHHSRDRGVDRYSRDW